MKMDMNKNSAGKGPLSWMAGHSVAANLLMVVLLVGGLIWGSRIKQEVFPDFDLDMVNITVSYPGASPEEVERGIILSIEEVIQGLEGIKEIRSSAQEGSATVSAELLEGENIQRLAQPDGRADPVHGRVKPLVPVPAQLVQAVVHDNDTLQKVLERSIHGRAVKVVLHARLSGGIDSPDVAGNDRDPAVGGLDELNARG